MIGKLPAVIAARDGQLLIKGLSINTDAHGGYLHCAVQHIVMEKYIAVHGPVVIVRRAAVVLFAVGQLIAYAYDKHGAAFLGYGPLTLLCGKIGISVQQFLGGYKRNLAGEVGIDIGIAGLEHI